MTNLSHVAQDERTARMALSMIVEAEKRGEIQPGDVLIEIGRASCRERVSSPV